MSWRHKGSYGKRHKLNPVTTLWHADVDKRVRDRQMPCKRLQPSYRSSANSLTLVPTGTTEYIAAGDSQAAVPFPTESEGISTFSERRFRSSYLLLQLAVMAWKRAFQRRALRRPHPARREVTCGDTDMDWPRLGAVLHTTGLWGRSYLGVGRRAASRTWQKLCQEKTRFTVRETLPWKNTHMGLPEGESGHTDT